MRGITWFEATFLGYKLIIKTCEIYERGNLLIQIAKLHQLIAIKTATLVIWLMSPMVIYPFELNT